jgi:hypothetical protein
METTRSTGAAERAAADETKQIKADAPPLPAEREPESEDAASVPRTGEEEAPKTKHEELAVLEDVEMECDEAAEDLDAYGASDEDDEGSDGGHSRGFASPPSSNTKYKPLYEETVTPVREYPEEYARYQIPEKDAAILSSGVALSPMWGGKRKRSADVPSASQGGSRVVVDGIDMGKQLSVTSKRKGSSDFLRKGQWTPTEERLARLLIEAFEEGYLPIYTGIRLRGYLAVQLQCDPMRVSKKLCAGTIDGKKIAKNYGQKKFRLRKKVLWDREEAGRILATLERLTKELWCETGFAQPQFLTLSTTRNVEDELSVTSFAAANRTQPTPVKKLSPPANKSKKQKNGVVFPIIYLNLSKKLKQGHGANASHCGGNGQMATNASLMYENVIRQYGIDSPYVQNPDGSIQIVGFAAHPNDSDTASTSSSDGQPVKVDGESLQAAYELLHLYHHCTSPSGSSTSRSSTPTEEKISAVTDEGHHTQKQQQGKQLDNRAEDKKQSRPNMDASPTNQQPVGIVPIRPAPAKPTILRQRAPSLSS